MLEAVRDREGTVNVTRMIHVVDEPDRFRALCGARLRGDIKPLGTPVDCLVCAELDAAVPYVR
jgi:hypothetical protein